MNATDDDGLMTQHTLGTVNRMSQNLPVPTKVCLDMSHDSYKLKCEQKDFDEDFLISKPTHYEYIQKLQQWRDRLESTLDSRPRLQPLALLSHYLTEFQYSKVDEIEVPGQYTEVRFFPECPYHCLTRILG